MKITNKYGYSLLDVIFIVIMPVLIIFAAIVALREPTYDSPVIPEEFISARVDPSFIELTTINVDFYPGNADSLIYIDKSKNKTIYSNTSVRQIYFNIDPNRPNADTEFFEMFNHLMTDAGFEIDNGLLPTNSEYEIMAASYLNANANRRCTILKKINQRAALTCADVDDRFTETIQRNLEEFSAYTPSGKLYVHEEFSTEYYGSEPRDNKEYEYARGSFADIMYISGVPIIPDDFVKSAVVFWRKAGEQWSMFIDTDFDKPEVEIACTDIDSVVAEALPNYICLDDVGQYKYLGIYYEI